MKLAELQHNFKSILHEGVNPESGSKLGVRDTTGVSTQTRLEIYEYAVWIRMESALAMDFPDLIEEIGKEKFSKLARNYFRQYPSRFASIAEISQDLPQYLRETKPWSDRPELAELAALEWSRAVASIRRRGESAPANVWEGLTEDALDRTYLRLNPSLQIYEPKIGAAKTVFAWADGIQEIEITNSQLGVLRSIQAGDSIAQMLGHLESSAIGPEQVMQWMSEWVTQGLIQGLHKKEDNHV